MVEKRKSGGGESELLHLLERRNEELRSLVEIGKVLTSSLEREDILSIIMEKVSQLLKPRTWSLLLVDEESGDLTFEIAVSPAAEHLKGIRLAIGQGIAGWVALHGEPLLIRDVHSDPRFAAQVDEATSFETRSIICVPVRNRDRILGVVELINNLDDGDFTEDDLTILSSIADYAAIAIENARNLRKVQELVITDDLTGLYNSRHLHALLDYEVERARRYDTPLSLVFIDLDHFKKVNDTHGHLTGSRLLSDIGRLIRSQIRRVDMAARYGGDEFVVIFPNTSKEGALAAVTKLRERIVGESFAAPDGSRIRVTASFGIATFPDDAPTKNDLIRCADRAMYDVKEAARDSIKAW